MLPNARARQVNGVFKNRIALAPRRPRSLRAVSEAPEREEDSTVLDVWGRFRYSDLKEAALFAADAMGFQSTLVRKLLKSSVFAARSSNRNSLNEPRSSSSRSPHRNALQTILQDSESRISDVASFGHAIASAAKRLRCVLGMLSNLEVKVLWPT